MNKSPDISKFCSFIAYCDKSLTGKKMRGRRFSNETDITDKFFNYHPIHYSYGNFIIQVDVLYFKYKNKFFGLGFQYQNETCKINCARTGVFYSTSIPEEIEDFKPAFKKNIPIGNRYNEPKTRAYISTSRKVYSISELSDDDFSQKLFEEFKSAIKIIEKMKVDFEKIGCQFF